MELILETETLKASTKSKKARKVSQEFIDKNKLSFNTFVNQDPFPFGHTMVKIVRTISKDKVRFELSFTEDLQVDH